MNWLSDNDPKLKWPKVSYGDLQKILHPIMWRRQRWADVMVYTDQRDDETLAFTTGEGMFQRCYVQPDLHKIWRTK